MIGIGRTDGRTCTLRKAFFLVSEEHKETYHSSATIVWSRHKYAVPLPPEIEPPIPSGHENYEPQRMLRSG
jgi:hypothetical protein